MTTTKPKKKRARILTCCCCGQKAYGRQWWNRDTGYGLCLRCGLEWIRSLGLQETEHSAGKRGVHWGICDEASVNVYDPDEIRKALK